LDAIKTAAATIEGGGKKGKGATGKSTFKFQAILFDKIFIL